MTHQTKKVLGIICAGGNGTRIDPLSRFVAKPAIGIGGNNRMLDIILSNLLNSGITQVYVIAQRHSHTIGRVLQGYHNGVSHMRRQFIEMLPPPSIEPRFFESDMDSLLQNRHVIAESDADIVVVGMADQVLKINLRDVIEEMDDPRVEAVMVYRDFPVAEAAGSLGVMTINRKRVVTEMEEKPSVPVEIPDKPGYCHANIALYAIRTKVFLEMLEHVASTFEPHQVLSRTGIPWLISRGAVRAFDLHSSLVPDTTEIERGYFADTGTVRAWFDAQMAMCQIHPAYNFYSEGWPMYSSPVWPTSPAKLDRVTVERTLFGFNVIAQQGVQTYESVIFTGTHLGDSSLISRSVCLFGSSVGAGSAMDHVVLDEGVQVPAGVSLSPAAPPSNTVSFETIYDKLKDGRSLTPEEESSAVVSDGLLIIPRTFRW